MKKKGKELSVKKAAQLLNLSERTVLNFIKQKKIQAIKVGRDWFIDYVSFISFSEKHEFDLSNVSENFGKVPKDSETFRISSESISERHSLSEKYESSNNEQKTHSGKQKLRPQNHLNSLRVYELSKNVFSHENFLNIPTSKIEERVMDLSHQTLEAIGSGFYAYSWDEKRFYYSRARSSAGGLMALITSKESLLSKWVRECHELEEVLIPALGALIKTVEKKALKEKIDGAEVRGRK